MISFNIKGTLILELENSHSLTEYFGRQIVAEYDSILNFITTKAIFKISYNLP